MADIVKAPNKYEKGNNFRIFLGGVIDNGKAEDWQEYVSNAFAEWDLTLLNPRREDWDPTWEPVITNPQFVAQVEWELQAQDDADIIIYVFGSDEESAKIAKAPVTMLELGSVGFYTGMVKVCCPKGFYRKGNVDIFCKKYDIPVYENLDKMIDDIKELLPAYGVKKIVPAE